jgi:hypothetical protein
LLGSVATHPVSTYRVTAATGGIRKEESRMKTKAAVLLSGALIARYCCRAISR